MMMLKDLINNDLIYYSLLISALFLAINTFSKFLENVIKIAFNLDLIFYYLKKFVIKLFKLKLKIVFFPITFWFLFKEWKLYNSLIINNASKKYEY